VVLCAVFFVVSCTFSQEKGTAETPGKLSRDFKYWRGREETTPGPFLCVKPAAANVKVVCDRWPDTTDLRQFGLDAIRLSKAETPTEKCLAVFRWLRRVMINSSAPYEPYAWDGCWDDYFKWLHVYGCHYCSGMGRSLEMYWRALGYPGSKVYTGHTVADVYYKDEDGAGRWHHFDVNRGRYMLDRSGKRLLSPEDLTVDSGFSRIGSQHRYQAAWSKHRAELALRRGEKIERIWGNWGKLYQRLLWPDRRIKGKSLEWWCKQSELGPYDRAHGNGRWTYSPDTSSENWRDGCAEAPVNMAEHRLMPVKPGIAAEAVWHFRTPYIVSDAEVDLDFFRKSEKDRIRLLLSVDDGTTYKPVWECPEEKTGKNKMTVNICKTFEVSKKKKPPMDFNSPFGRYRFRVKLELNASGTAENCRVDSITFRTVVQQNKFALPQLQPGKNSITVTGDLDKDDALRVTYVWDDPEGKGRKNVTVIEKTPYTYEIIAAGKKWEDCVCASLIVEAIPSTGKGNRTEVKEKPSRIHTLPPLPPVHKTCGSWPLSKRGVPVKLPPLSEVLKRLNTKTSYSKLRDVVVPQLIEYADPKTWDAALGFIKACTELPRKKHGRLMKCKKGVFVALYAMEKDKAKFRKFMREFIKDPDMSWGCESVVATIAQLNGWTEFVPYLAGLLEEGKGSRVSILKAFIKMGDERTAEAVKKCLAVKSTAVLPYAAVAAGRTGDRSLIPRLRELMRWELRLIENFRPAKIAAVVGLGMLKDTESIPEIKKFLKHTPHEAWRAKAARSLAYMGEKSSIPALKAALSVEPAEWVRDAIKESIEILETGRIVHPLLGGKDWIY